MAQPGGLETLVGRGGLASCRANLASGSCLSPRLTGIFHARPGHPHHPWHLDLLCDLSALQSLSHRGRASNLVTTECVSSSGSPSLTP